MGTVAVIGEDVRVRGFALAGALVYPAGTAGEARAAWRALPSDVAVVILTARAAVWLRDVLAAQQVTGPAVPAGEGGEGLPRRPGLLHVVMPP